jgi:hypothetical protein
MHDVAAMHHVAVMHHIAAMHHVGAMHDAMPMHAGDAASDPPHSATQDDGRARDAPAAPHCPYCLDFAAGAALAPALPWIAAPHVAFAPVTEAEQRVAAPRSSLRLPAPRAPPVVA